MAKSAPFALSDSLSGFRTKRILKALTAVMAITMAGCGSGGSGTGDASLGSGFQVLEHSPASNGKLFLNEPVEIVFNREVDLDTATLNTIVFSVFDSASRASLTEQVTGTFQVGINDEGLEDKRYLVFLPKFPTNDSYTDGGFKPGRTYLVSMTTSSNPNGPVLRDTGGRGLREAPADFVFSTPTGTTPAELFKNPLAGGPHKVRMAVSPSTRDASGTIIAPLNHLSQEPVEVRLVFDQALNPASSNVPVNQSIDPLQRASRVQGRAFLEYDDPVFGNDTWIKCAVDLEVNSPTGSELVLRPDGVLPNNALVRVIVESTLEDIAGESNLQVPGFNRVFGTFRTSDSYAPQYDAYLERFDSDGLIDKTAPFLNPFADVENGALRASFDFEGTETPLNYEPRNRDVILNTDFTSISPSNGEAFNVSGGVFNFNNVTIRSDVSVRGIGSKPMVWLITGDLLVEGRLSVDGGNGARVDTLNSANFPTPGGVGNCTGGKGGDGSPSAVMSSLFGQTGFGPANRANGGGRGGEMGCGTAGTKKGSGGGGGSHITQGDPLYNDGNPIGGPNFVQWRGTGGFGVGIPTNLPGGPAGPIRSADGNLDNDFVGSMIDLNRTNVRRIPGEFVSPLGGAGGGGGGDRSTGTPCQSGPSSFINDNKGGGGGGGAGVLIVKCLGKITVTRTGLISANGGHGHGGEQAASNNQGGGGGGGGGGVVILQSASGIFLHKHGGVYSAVGGGARDYTFSVSADGAASLRGNFGSTPIDGKYPVVDIATGSTTNSGGFGGMGIVQLMAPPGNNTQDGTNTALDDNIHIIEADGVTRATGLEKQRFIAWTGIRPLPTQAQPNPTPKDDNGVDIPNYGGGGDIRPRPMLLPPTYGRMSQARTRWIWTGYTDRREVVDPDGAPRGVRIDPANNILGGPEYSFAGTFSTGNQAGYIAYENDTGIIQYPLLVPRTAVAASLPLGAIFNGRPVHKLVLTGSPLGDIPNRFANHRVVVRGPPPSSAVLVELRILEHNQSELLLDPDDGVLPESATTGEVLAKFFGVRTNGTPGLGPLYNNGASQIPVANVQFGFAFHRDPNTPDLTVPGEDQNRFPRNLRDFATDLSSAANRELLRSLHYEYLMVDVKFNIDYSDNPVNPGSNRAGPSSPRPELTYLALPYRY